MTEPIRSPNIWESPEVYELENLAVDRTGVIEAAMREIDDWAGRDVLDIGCGTGFHLPGFAATARTVVGVEPHPPLVVAGPLPGGRAADGAGGAGVGGRDDAARRERRRGPRAVGLLLRARVRTGSGRAGPGAAARRDRVRRRQRRHAVDLRGVVPAQPPALRPAGGGAVLASAGAGRGGRSTSPGRSTPPRTSPGCCASSSRPLSPTRSSRPTPVAPASTTRSTSGGGRSERATPDTWTGRRAREGVSAVLGMMSR